MIITFILNALMVMGFGLITPVIDLPDISTSISSAGTVVITLIGDSMTFLRWLYSPTLFSAICGVALAVFLFKYGYGTVMWIMSKIPFINIH